MDHSSWLPFDVIAHVMAFSPPSVITALMSTCRAYYNEGPKHLLRDGVALRSVEEIDGFTTFMFAQETTRFPFLKSLELAVHDSLVPSIYPAMEKAGACLAKLLGCPQLCLETLILRDVGRLWQYSVDARGALGALTTIKHLVIRGHEEYTLSVLESLPSPLVSITISCPPYIETLHEEAAEFNVAHILLRFSGTLELIRCNQFVSDGRSYPHIKTFGILCSIPKLSELNPTSLFLSFPHLSGLELVPDDRCPIASTLGFDLKEADRIRDRNKAIQRHEGSVRILTECFGELYTLYTMGFICKISRLHIWKLLYTVDHLPLLLDILTDTCPTELSLSVYGFDVLAASVSILRAEACDSLRSFNVVFALEPYKHKDPEAFLDGVLESLLPLPPCIHVLNLKMHVENSLFLGDVSELLVPMEELQGLRRRIEGSTPSLKRVTVQLTGSYVPDWPDLGQTEESIDDSEDGMYSPGEIWSYSDEDEELYGRDRDSDGIDSDCYRRWAD